MDSDRNPVPEPPGPARTFTRPGIFAPPWMS